MFMLTRGILIVMFFVMSFSVMAGPFGGISFGEADVDISGYNSSSTRKLFAGFRSGNWGGELADIDMGNFMVTGSADYVSAGGTEISAMFFHDVSGTVTLFGKGGMFNWTTSASTTALTIPSDNGWDMTYGIGILYKHSALPFKIRAEYQIFQDVSTTDIDMWTIGVHFD